LTGNVKIRYGSVLESLMDFSLPDELIELKERTERFVRERILPFEADLCIWRTQ
jgi:hypothetical protein